MSLHDDLSSVRRSLEALTRQVERLEKRASRQPPGDPPDPSEMVSIPDTPYDSALWTDTDDEGLGARNRRAP